MLEYIKNELLSFNIDSVSALPLSLCRVHRPYKLEGLGFRADDPLFVIILAIPYYTEESAKNISSYAIPRDYHLFCKELFTSLIPRLTARFEGKRFYGFADDSPIDEREAAALAGLGVLGENGLLITEKYSSYVFLGEIITDLPLTLSGEFKIERCEGCGLCRAACPKAACGECLSALTQKKGELTPEERQAIKDHGSAWGCDICSEVCPYTKRAIERGTIYTNIDFFRRELIPVLSSELVGSMSDSDFACRAYSWRKRDTIIRNLKILEEDILNRKEDELC